MTPLTQDDRDEITAAMLGVLERYSGEDGPDLALARELGRACCQIVEEHAPGRAVLPVQMPPIFAVCSRTMTPPPPRR